MSRRLLVISSLTILATITSSTALANTDIGINNQETGRQMRVDIRETGTQLRVESKEDRENLRAEFKAKLQTIKDETKKEIVSKLDTRFASVNKNATDRFSEVLDKLSTVLAKIQTKAAQAKAAGKDTTTLDADIVTAQNLISSAKFEITQQADKEYTITISTEDTLRTDVGKTASSLRADLQTVHKTVVDAKQAVMKAASDLAQLNK